MYRGDVLAGYGQSGTEKGITGDKSRYSRVRSPDRDTCPLMGGRVTGWRSLPSQATGRLYLLVATCTAFGNLDSEHLSAGTFLVNVYTLFRLRHIVSLSIHPSVCLCVHDASKRFESLSFTRRTNVEARRSKIVDFIVEGIGFNLKWNFDNSCVPTTTTTTTRNGSLFPTWRWSRFPPRAWLTTFE